jgi:glucose-1-phosphate adenylyltransferase
VRVNSHSLVEDAVILPQCDVGNHVVVKRAVIDRGCLLPDGIEVGLNPAEDRRRFHVSARGITLVTPAMLGQPVFTIR